MAGYREAVIEARGEECEICSSTVDLLIHHIDGNRDNNCEDNLVVTCDACHNKIHTAKTHGSQWDNYTEKLPESALKSRKNAGDMKRTTVSIRKSQHEWVKSNNINLSSLVREAIDDQKYNRV